MPKILNLFPFKSLSVSLSDKKAIKKVNIKAIMQYSGLIDEKAEVKLSSLISSKTKPPIMIGMLKRKLYSAAFSFVSPARISEQIVLPERDIPGRTAKP